MTPISIGYFSNRTDPKFAWFVDSLAKQVPENMRDQIEIVFVDHKLWKPKWKDPNADGNRAYNDQADFDHERAWKIEQIVNRRFQYSHITPAPNPWQGPFKQTKIEFFDASGARNTFLAAAKHPYVVHVDDLSVLGPIWFAQVLHAAQDGYCVAGAYKKLKKMVVENGELKSFEEFPAGIDSRWDRGSDAGIVPWTGAALYGCSFGAPLELMLKINGNDLFCSSQGGEDTDTGIRMHRAGGRFFYNRNMLTLESEEDHFKDEPFKRISKLVTNTAHIPFGYNKNRMSDHVMLNRVLDEERITTLSQHDMRAIREQFQQRRTFAIPQPGQLDWRDGQPLSEL